MADHHKTKGIDSCTFIRKFYFIIILVSEYPSLPFDKKVCGRANDLSNDKQVTEGLIDLTCLYRTTIKICL